MVEFTKNQFLHQSNANVLQVSKFREEHTYSISVWSLILDLQLKIIVFSYKTWMRSSGPQSLERACYKPVPLDCFLAKVKVFQA